MAEQIRSVVVQNPTGNVVSVEYGCHHHHLARTQKRGWRMVGADVEAPEGVPPFNPEGEVAEAAVTESGQVVTPQAPEPEERPDATPEAAKAETPADGGPLGDRPPDNPAE